MVALQKKLKLVLSCSCLLAFSFCSASSLAYPPDSAVSQKKPHIEEYEDYSNFISDIIRYKKRQSKLKRQKKRFRITSASLTPANKKPLDPKNITNPETITQAVKRAKSFMHPTYDEKLRYDRTTSQSFSLPKMANREMSGQNVKGVLEDTAAVEFREIKLDDTEVALNNQGNSAKKKAEPDQGITDAQPEEIRYNSGIFVDSQGRTTHITHTGDTNLREVTVTVTSSP